MAKALLIKSSAGSKENIQGAWHLFEQATPYIQGIQTGDILETVDADILNSMISGLPSIWSRSRVFAYAFKYTQKDVNIRTSGLIKFYEAIIREWKGLIALMALFPNRITISKPIELQGNTIDPLYNIPNAFGRMLFEDVDLWCDPYTLKELKKEQPFIQLVYYNNVLIGATSPYTLVFTGIDYTKFPDSPDVLWFRNGKLDDPLEFGNLYNDQIQKLYWLVNNLCQKLPDFETYIQSNRNGKEPLSLSPIYVFLQNWRNEIKAKGRNLAEEGALDAELVFAAPFTKLFRIKQDLYYKNGVFSYSDSSGVLVDLQKILLQDDFIYSFTQVDERQPMDESAVYYLRALDPDDQKHTLYFPIPLSAYGLKLFKNQIGDLISAGSDEKHELRATFKPRDYKVIIELFLRVDGKKQTPIVKEYEIKLLTGAQRNIIMWPNFISRDWNKYFLYNEYPSNSRDIKFVPFFKEFSEESGYDGGGFVLNDKAEIVYPDSDVYGTNIEINRVVKYPVEIATSEDHPYEVLRTNKPVAGLEIRSLINGKDRVCGYLVVKKANDDSMHDKKIQDLSYETIFDEVVVGIDFGSNNSCISYSRYNQSTEPIPFKNRRIFLLGAETFDPNQEKTANRNELLFFQNESPVNGQIKSWLHDHNQKYIPVGSLQDEIAGGVPIFKPNILIHNMDERTITTNAGTLHHSMKWLSDAKGREKKQAFLKTVWIKAVADLYAMKLKPKELRWSYPGSFTPFDIGQYQLMYNELANIPVFNTSVEVSYTPSTEAEAVCNYALTKGGLTSSNIMLGIDVGGSTANILVVAMDRAARAFKMVKQSSLRISAGVFSEIIKKSAQFRQSIFKYHEGQNKMKVANIKNILDNPKTAPFYLNSVLDRLRDDEFNNFYSSLAKSTPQVFAIPAYVTGLLLYYSGQLISKAIQENGYTSVTIIDLMPFGKGGRIFDWLDVYPGVQRTSKYYNDCFKAGFGEGSERIRLEKKDSIRVDNKSEVSKGLSAPQKIVVDQMARDNSDVFGEKGFMYFAEGSNQGAELLDTDQINTQHLEEMDFGIEPPQTFVRFEQFLNIYLDFVGPRNTGIVKNTAILEQKKAELFRELKGFICNDPEWQKADEQRRQGQPFEFKHSMIVLEGMCFLEKFLIPEVFK